MTTSAATSLSREVTAFCVHCGHGAVLDLKALLEAGDGDTELIALPLRCTSCSKRVIGSRSEVTTPRAVDARMRQAIPVCSQRGAFEPSIAAKPAHRAFSVMSGICSDGGSATQRRNRLGELTLLRT
jgi:hypothetical protein